MSLEEKIKALRVIRQKREDILIDVLIDERLLRREQ